MKLKLLAKGIHITTSNGKKFSIQIGEYNYCSNNTVQVMNNYSHDSNLNCNTETPLESEDAEVAVIASDGRWVTGDYFENSDGQVAGYVPIERILRQIMAEENLLSLSEE